MTVSIAVTGKGGTGKTTIAALLVHILVEKTGGLVLAIDADPNSNLNESLGTCITKTVGDIREGMLRERIQLVEQSKSEYLRDMIQSSISEGDGFDLIAMGRPEGPGCYCYLNNLLRKIIDSTSDQYPYVVMDTEAGLEHFSRRTTKDLDILLIATDPTRKGIVTARRIIDLVKEMRIQVKKIYLIVNRVHGQVTERLKEQISEEGLDCIGLIPEDPLVQDFDLEGKPLNSLPKNSQAYNSMLLVAEKLLLFN